MKSLMKKIDLFCYRHPRFGIPNLMLYIVVGNAIVWLFSMFAPEILDYIYFSPYLILHGQIWRLVTFIIYPVNTGYLAIITFYFYYMIGRTLEQQWGPGKFTIYFFSGVFLTILYCFAAYLFVSLRIPADLTLPRDLDLLAKLPLALDTSLLQGISLSAAEGAQLRSVLLQAASVPATATYIYFSMFFAFAALYPDMQVLLFFVIPIKMKWLAIVDGVFFAYEIISSFAAGQILYGLLPVVALLNFLLFCGGSIFARLRPAPRAQRQNVVNFKSEVRRIQYEQQTKPYTRKCEVCGRTDTDFPDLEFRYCSRCAGYHCFCIDHINDHRHFTE